LDPAMFLLLPESAFFFLASSSRISLIISSCNSLSSSDSVDSKLSRGAEQSFVSIYHCPCGTDGDQVESLPLRKRYSWLLIVSWSNLPIKLAWSSFSG
jgi:hypothetical protein